MLSLGTLSLGSYVLKLMLYGSFGWSLFIKSDERMQIQTNTKLS